MSPDFPFSLRISPKSIASEAPSFLFRVFAVVSRDSSVGFKLRYGKLSLEGSDLCAHP